LGAAARPACRPAPGLRTIMPAVGTGWKGTVRAKAIGQVAVVGTVSTRKAAAWATAIMGIFSTVTGEYFQVFWIDSFRGTGNPWFIHFSTPFRFVGCYNICRWGRKGEGMAIIYFQGGFRHFLANIPGCNYYLFETKRGEVIYCRG